jgi:hypothetical protein
MQLLDLTRRLSRRRPVGKPDVSRVHIEKDEPRESSEFQQDEFHLCPAPTEFLGFSLAPFFPNLIRKIGSFIFWICGGEIEQEWGFDDSHFDRHEFLVVL